MKHMTVGELVQWLSVLDPDMPLIMSRDPEGNSFSPLDDAAIEVCNVYEENYYEVLHPDDADEYPDDELTNVVCFWPTY